MQVNLRFLIDKCCFTAVFRYIIGIATGNGVLIVSEIKRDLEPVIKSWLEKKRIITIFGPRQVGKTTLSKRILMSYGTERDYFNCDIPSVAKRFEEPEPMVLTRLFGDSRFVVIDEAQRIRDIGLTLKVIHDAMPDMRVIATGSSSFSLRNAVNEPLTGRSKEFLLLPFSLNELRQVYREDEIDSLLPFFLRYGLYPDIVSCNEKDAEALVSELSSNYLYKDIMDFENLKKPDLLLDLLRLLAFQVGAEVSMNELATKLRTSRETVERYIELLEKSFVLFRLKPLSNNQRNEIKRKEKIYFYDTGVRNSIIAAFQPIELRKDLGGLFENLMIAERLKFLEYNGMKRNLWFWRTHDRKEIDFVEEYSGGYDAYEFKWGKGKGKIKKAAMDEFSRVYKNVSFKVVNRDNYFEFVF